jgi:hypothetical protein
MKKLILLFLLSSNCFAEIKWECIERGAFTCRTDRLIVPSGWIVKYFGFREFSIAFVPDPEHKWKV